jgi:hypothetical protein
LLTESDASRIVHSGTTRLGAHWAAGGETRFLSADTLARRAGSADIRRSVIPNRRNLAARLVLLQVAAGLTVAIPAQGSASHRLSWRLAGFRRGKGVSQAQSGKGGRKGCAPLGSCMPVDSATAYVGTQSHRRRTQEKGEPKAAGDLTAGSSCGAGGYGSAGGGEGGKWRVSASIDARSPYPSDAVWVHPRSPDAYPDVRKMISAGVSSQAVLRQYLAVSFRRSRHWAYRLRPSRLAPQ